MPIEYFVRASLSYDCLFQEAVAMTTETNASPTASKKGKNKKEKKPAANKNEQAADQIVQSEASYELVNQSETLSPDPITQADISNEVVKEAEVSHSEPIKEAAAAPDSRPARSPKKKRKTKVSVLNNYVSL